MHTIIQCDYMSTLKVLSLLVYDGLIIGHGSNICRKTYVIISIIVIMILPSDKVLFVFSELILKQKIK